LTQECTGFEYLLEARAIPATLFSTYTADDIQVFNSDTGADVTAAWLTFTGITARLRSHFQKTLYPQLAAVALLGTILDTIAVVGYIELPELAASQQRSAYQQAQSQFSKTQLL
jgi:hypothetical protein